MKTGGVVDAGPARETAHRPVRLLVLFLLAWAMLEIASLGGLRLLRQRFGLRYRPLHDFFTDEDRDWLAAFMKTGDGWYHHLDPLLGWVTRPSATLSGKSPMKPATQNAQGVRSLHAYPDLPRAGVLRVAAFGDSFVHGDEVGDGEEWAAVVERSLPGIEVMNFGVSGYGPDQAFLRWQRDGIGVRPDVVVIGYMTENLLRTQNVFRPFYERGSGFRLAKPRFRLEEGRLVLLPNPLATPSDFAELVRDPEGALARLGRDDAFFAGSGGHAVAFDFLPSVRFAMLLPAAIGSARRAHDLSYAPGSAALLTTRAILEAFCRDVQAHGARPLIAMFPNEQDIESRRHGGAAAPAELVSDLRRANCPTLELLEAFDRDAPATPIRELFGQMHYSALGNRIVARRIGEAIERLRSPPGALGDRSTSAPVEAGSIVPGGAFGVAMRR